MSGTMYPGVATGTVQCPHCGAVNTAGGQFCQSCGKALPSATASGPRIVSGATLASTSAGQKLQSDELVKTAKKARGALLAAAIIATAWTVLLYFLVKAMSNGRAQLPLMAMVVQGGVAAVFWGLWGWSMRQPLPAAIVGLILYGTLVVINVITNVSSMSANGGQGGGGIGGLGIGWIDIIILASLGQGIAAASKHRKLLAQQQQQGL